MQMIFLHRTYIILLLSGTTVGKGSLHSMGINTIIKSIMLRISKMGFCGMMQGLMPNLVLALHFEYRLL